MNNNAPNKFVLLKNLVEICSGYTNRGAEYSGKLYSVLQVNDINDDYRIDLDHIEKKIQANPGQQYILREGEIVFVSKGEYNKASLVPANIKDVIASNTFLILRNFSKLVLPEYILWYINSKTGQEYLDGVRRGNTIPYIPISVLQEMPVLVPSLEEQKQLTEIAVLKEKELSIRNRILELRKKLIETEMLNHINKTSTR